MKAVKSSVAGKLIAFSASVGAQVSRGEEVAIIECMKMEIPVESELAGRIIEILVKEGDDIEEGQQLALLE